jgi:hypothetical protein
VGQRCHGRILRESSETRNYKFLKIIHYFSRVVLRTIDLSRPFRFLLGGLKIGFKMPLFKIDRMTLNFQVKIRDCRVLVGPYPPCTLTAFAATWIFEVGVGNQTSIPMSFNEDGCDLRSKRM